MESRADRCRWGGSGSCPRTVDEERVGVHRAAGKHVDAVVEVGWSASSVAGVADVAYDVAAPNETSFVELAEAVEVGEVVNPKAGAQDLDDVAAERIATGVEDEPVHR